MSATDLQITTVPHWTREEFASGHGIRHAFFGRQGGESNGVYQSLNIGLRNHDRRELVVKNRKKIASVFDLSFERLLVAKQVHGTDCLYVNEPFDPFNPPMCDAFVTDRPGLALGASSADCGPLLWAETQAGIIASSHCGWRGALDGVAESTIAAMIRLGASLERIEVVLGPMIAEESYEVGQEFYDHFLRQDPESSSSFSFNHQSGRHHFNLRFYLEQRLKKNQIGRVHHIEFDTFAREDLFFSYRRATVRKEAGNGLQLAAISLCGH